MLTGEPVRGGAAAAAAGFLRRPPCRPPPAPRDRTANHPGA